MARKKIKLEDLIGNRTTLPTEVEEYVAYKAPRFTAGNYGVAGPQQMPKSKSMQLAESLGKFATVGMKGLIAVDEKRQERVGAAVQNLTLDQFQKLNTARQEGNLQEVSDALFNESADQFNELERKGIIRYMENPVHYESANQHIGKIVATDFITTFRSSIDDLVQDENYSYTEAAARVAQQAGLRGSGLQQFNQIIDNSRIVDETNYLNKRDEYVKTTSRNNAILADSESITSGVIGIDSFSATMSEWGSMTVQEQEDHITALVADVAAVDTSKAYETIEFLEDSIKFGNKADPSNTLLENLRRTVAEQQRVDAQEVSFQQAEYAKANENGYNSTRSAYLSGNPITEVAVAGQTLTLTGPANTVEEAYTDVLTQLNAMDSSDEVDAARLYAASVLNTVGDLERQNQTTAGMFRAINEARTIYGTSVQDRYVLEGITTIEDVNTQVAAFEDALLAEYTRLELDPTVTTEDQLVKNFKSFVEERMNELRVKTEPARKEAQLKAERDAIYSGGMDQIGMQSKLMTAFSTNEDIYKNVESVAQLKDLAEQRSQVYEQELQAEFEKIDNTPDITVAEKIQMKNDYVRAHGTLFFHETVLNASDEYDEPITTEETETQDTEPPAEKIESPNMFNSGGGGLTNNYDPVKGTRNDPAVIKNNQAQHALNKTRKRADETVDYWNEMFDEEMNIGTRDNFRGISVYPTSGIFGAGKKPIDEPISRLDYLSQYVANKEYGYERFEAGLLDNYSFVNARQGNAGISLEELQSGQFTKYGVQFNPEEIPHNIPILSHSLLDAIQSGTDTDEQAEEAINIMRELGINTDNDTEVQTFIVKQMKVYKERIGALFQNNLTGEE